MVAPAFMSRSQPATMCPVVVVVPQRSFPEPVALGLGRVEIYERVRDRARWVQRRTRARRASA
jgi:hypothetical protein